MEELATYKELIEQHISGKIQAREPRGLYDPMVYIMNLGGKRLRPTLTLLAAELCGYPADAALDAALAVEVFHNFSLVHDDIMDGAQVRRGQPTVHEKWDLNTGILSGDLMLICAYQLLQDYPAETQKALTGIFSHTAREVCEGQQWDVEFEQLEEVSLEEYIRMIQLKTAVLLGCALKMGAIVAGAAQEKQDGLYRFGLLLGTAFQLQDDYLDTFGEEESFGKRIGGDILEGKKTFLYIDSLKKLQASDRESLLSLYSRPLEDEESHIRLVTDLFRKAGSDLHIRDEVGKYTQRALEELENFDTELEAVTLLRSYSELLTKRTV